MSNIIIKTEAEIELMRYAGKIVYRTHQYLKQYLKPGISTIELDDLAYKFITKNNCTPSFKNYNGFPCTITTSINDEVVHGIPGDRKLKDGDIISIDIGAIYKGFHADSGWTYPVGTISDNLKTLLDDTETSLYKGLDMIKPGNKIGDISNAIEIYATSKKLGIVRELVGHGVGSNLHEDPEIPNYGKKNTGPIIKENMVFAVEPMLNLGSKDVVMKQDGWTICTRDGKPSAHFEHTVVVSKDGYEILTKE